MEELQNLIVKAKDSSRFDHDRYRGLFCNNVLDEITTNYG